MVVLTSEQRKAIEWAIGMASQHNIHNSPLRELLAASTAPAEGRDDLREAARQFHNLTQGDPTVIIRPPSAEKRDAIIAAGERLRAALATTPTQPAEGREPTGDQVRAIIKSVGSLGTNHADAPMEYVLAGWRAATAPTMSEAVRSFIRECAALGGGMVNGNRLSAQAATILAEIERIDRAAERGE
jgi:hypothetical protein